MLHCTVDEILVYVFDIAFSPLAVVNEPRVLEKKKRGKNKILCQRRTSVKDQGNNSS